MWFGPESFYITAFYERLLLLLLFVVVVVVVVVVFADRIDLSIIVLFIFCLFSLLL